MTWRPITEFPNEVGEYVVKDAVGWRENKVRWDGRFFRYADGDLAGLVFPTIEGDLWRLQSNETKEAEMLNEHDLQDMRPDEPSEWNERADALVDEWMRPAFLALEAFCAASQPKEPR